MKRTTFSPNNALYIEYVKNTQKYNMPVQHYHDAYEIYLQLAGKRYAFCDNICYTLERGDLVIFRPFDIHYFESRESDYYERYAVNFQENVISGLLSSEEKYVLFDKIKPCVVHLDEEQTATMYDCFKRADMFSKKTGFLAEKLTSTAFLQLTAYTAECIDDKNVIEGNKASPQIVSAIEYINSNYTNQLSLEDIAEKACMSKFHFSRKFKEVTGATVLEYLNNVRLTKVHSLLVSSDESIGAIVEMTGFSSSLHLTRVFKEIYGVAPSVFRKNNSNI